MVKIMKLNFGNMRGFRAAGLAAGIAGTLALAGCATSGGGGTAALNDTGRVQGRDLGRGGATSGGISSLEQSGNAADYSVYDARQLEGQQKQAQHQ
jgi:hypothetical protein